MGNTAIRARELYEKDARFRLMAQSAVHRAMDDFGRVDPERADEGAYEVALRATINVLKEAFESDAELTRTQIERDHYKKLALTAAHNFVMPITLEHPTPPSTDHRNQPQP